IGTPGVDINFCGVHDYATGEGVGVVVMDEGMETDHPDLNNVISQGSIGGIPFVTGDHGMACAGIIGAQANNAIGFAGIAPDCDLRSYALNLSGDIQGTPPWDVATMMDHAWQNHQADIISNSWSTISFFAGSLVASIRRAMTQGRNGLGTVVVFSAGNNDTDGVSFPSGSDSRILTIGAMSPCGERKSPTSCDGEGWWGSNFGSSIDVVAPGTKITTTDLNQGYINNFNGTSSACPHVSGLAALLIEVDPTLTLAEITEIIESTAQKVGGYNYTTTSGRPNGTWHNEMGYGLIDATAAVLKASGGLLSQFGVPRASAIPTGFRKFSNVHTIGTNGPDLSNVFNSVFNWWGNSSNPNGLYQFTLETLNGTPRHFTEITQYATYSLAGPNPEISINSAIGFSGLEGDYWVNLDGDNLVLVEKSGEYALYFSTSGTPPVAAAADLLIDLPTTEQTSYAFPNPFSLEATLNLPKMEEPLTVKIYNSVGNLIETFSTSDAKAVIGINYPPGLYHVELMNANFFDRQTIVKK
ncbi:MAG: S8 family peptidase, partial [Bacteroidota bacterium]